MLTTVYLLLFPFLWTAIGIAIMGVIVLILYLHREVQRYPPKDDIVIVAEPIDRELKYELGQHKEAVRKLSQVIEETRTTNGTTSVRNHLT